MPALATAVFALAVLAYASWSVPLDRWHLTAPMVFTVLGTLLGLIAVEPRAEVVHDLAELTLALVLFHDAAQVRPRQLRPDAAMCARLLLVGLPLTMALGFGVAWLLMPGAGVWLALLVGAALAPTDAGLGAATVLNPVVPVRIRRVLNVESGLNDGLATPVVLFAIAAAGGTTPGLRGSLGSAAVELVIGLVVGVVVGAGAGRLLSWAHRRGHVETGVLPLATLAIPLATYYGALGVHGNGFVAAFVAGTAAATGFTAHELAGPADGEQGPLALTASLSTILGFAVWALFGAVGVAHLGSTGTWRGVVYAVLSLTVLRMLPVALVLVGSGLARPTRWFIGWFGPRGLASVVFALIAVETLPSSPQLAVAMGTLTATVLLSVVLHGVTAAPWAQAYGQWVERTRPGEELGESVEPASPRGHLRLSPRGPASPAPGP